MIPPLPAGVNKIPNPKRGVMNGKITLLTAVLAVAAVNTAAVTEAEEWYNKGLDYEEEGEYEKAIEYFDRVLERQRRRSFPYW
jgi:outer membrane protein assembly factor BamD (BamD/ComL family)